MITEVQEITSSIKNHRTDNYEKDATTTGMKGKLVECTKLPPHLFLGKRDNAQLPINH